MPYIDSFVLAFILLGILVFDILYKTYMGGVARDGSSWVYDFKMYGLHLLGGVLIWQGVKCLRAAQLVICTTRKRSRRLW